MKTFWFIMRWVGLLLLILLGGMVVHCIGKI